MNDMLAHMDGRQAFLDLVADYVDAVFCLHPQQGVEDGYHRYALEGLDDLSPQALAGEERSLLAFLRRLEDLPAAGLDLDLWIDRQRLEAHIQARLHELQVIRPHARSPFYYAELVQGGVLSQMVFAYPGATLDARCQAALSALQSTPRLMQDAAYWLQAVDPDLLEYGLDNLAETRRFLLQEVGPFFAGARLDDGSPAAPLLERWLAEAAHAIQDLEDILRSRGRYSASLRSFAMGEAALARRLRLREGLDLPEERPFAAILGWVALELECLQVEFRQVAAVLDPSCPAEQVWARVQQRHPAPGQVAHTAQAQVETIVRFLEDKDLVTIPRDEVMDVRPAPACLLHWYASMWQCGPFEDERRGPLPPAVYYVSDPVGLLLDEHGQRDEQAEHEFLQGMVTSELWSTSAHEGYPGHFLQGCAQRQVRRQQVDAGRLSWVAAANLFAPFHYVEGWAHYTEQMVREAGLLQDGDPRQYREYLLGQVSDALLRLCRTWAGIQLHLGKLDLEQAAQFIHQNSFVHPTLAWAEAQRLAYEPDAILYAIGKRMVLDVRQAYQAALERRGETFTLRRFHDDFLALGQYPLPVIKEKMLRSLQ
jgi:hypothetical protein